MQRVEASFPRSVIERPRAGPPIAVPSPLAALGGPLPAALLANAPPPAAAPADLPTNRLADLAGGTDAAEGVYAAAAAPRESFTNSLEVLGTVRIGPLATNAAKAAARMATEPTEGGLGQTYR